MRINEIVTAIDYLFKAKITPMLVGHSGKGKTTVVEQYGLDHGYDVIHYRLGEINDVGDLIGLPSFKKDENGVERTTFAAPLQIPIEGYVDRPVIIFLDEVNRTHKDLINAVFRLAEKGEYLGPHKLDSRTRIVAACNPPGDEYTVMDFKDKAFNARFCHLVFDPSKDEFINYARDRFDNEMLEFLQTNSEFIDDKAEGIIDLSYVSPTRRSWERVNNLVFNLKLPESIRLEVVSGIVGSPAAICFEKFIKSMLDKKLDAVRIFNEYESFGKEEIANNLNNNPKLNVLIDDLLHHIKEKVKTPDEAYASLEQLEAFNHLFTDKDGTTLAQIFAQIPVELMMSRFKDFIQVRDLLVKPAFFRTCCEQSDLLATMKKQVEIKFSSEAKVSE